MTKFTVVNKFRDSKRGSRLFNVGEEFDTEGVSEDRLNELQEPLKVLNGPAIKKEEDASSEVEPDSEEDEVANVELEELTAKELRELAKEADVYKAGMKKDDLIAALK